MKLGNISDSPEKTGDSNWSLYNHYIMGAIFVSSRFFARLSILAISELARQPFCCKHCLFSFLLVGDALSSPFSREVYQVINIKDVTNQ